MPRYLEACYINATYPYIMNVYLSSLDVKNVQVGLLSCYIGGASPTIIGLSKVVMLIALFNCFSWILDLRTLYVIFGENEHLASFIHTYCASFRINFDIFSHIKIMSFSPSCKKIYDRWLCKYINLCTMLNKGNIVV